MEIVVNKRILLVLAFISLNASAALYASDVEVVETQTETSEVAANETAAAEEQVKEVVPQKSCGCPNNN